MLVIRSLAYANARTCATGPQHVNKQEAGRRPPPGVIHASKVREPLSSRRKTMAALCNKSATHSVRETGEREWGKSCSSNQWNAAETRNFFSLWLAARHSRLKAQDPWNVCTQSSCVECLAFEVFAVDGVKRFRKTTQNLMLRLFGSILGCGIQTGIYKW